VGANLPTMSVVLTPSVLLIILNLPSCQEEAKSECPVHGSPAKSGHDRQGSSPSWRERTHPSRRGGGMGHPRGQLSRLDA
jgi:hypothetical protein